MGIFNTLNSRNFCIFWFIDLKLAGIFQNGVIYIVLKFCPKNCQFKFLMTSLETMNRDKSDVMLLCITLHNVCAVHWGMCSTLGDVQYTGGYHEYTGDTMSTLGGYHEYSGDTVSTRGAYHNECGDILSTLGMFNTLGDWGIP